MIRYTEQSGGFRRDFQSLLARSKNPTAVLMGVGREATNLLKKHFREKDRTSANKLSPDRRQHLWLEISRGVNAPVQSGYNSVSVSINHPAIAQKVFGGTIVAKRVRNLAIPQSPDAYGRSPATFERETGLKLFVLKQGGTAGNSHESLVLAAARVAGIEIEYILTPRVDQKPDPTALPDEKQFTDALLARGRAIVDRQNGEGNSKS